MADLTPEQIHELNSVVAGAGGETTPGQVPKIDVVTQGNILRAQTERQVARDKLDELQADPAWGKLLVAKDPATLEEFQKLTATIANDDPPVTIEGLAAGTRERQFFAAVDAFGAQHDLPVDVIADVKAGGTVSPEERKLAEEWLDRHQRDRDWCKRLTDGDVTAAREMALVSVILSATVAAKTKKVA